MSNLWKRNGLVPRDSFDTGIQSLFEDFFNGFGSRAMMADTMNFSPKLNVSETETEYRVTAELPGLTENDFEVVLDGDLLRIKGEKKSQKEDKQEHYHRYESSYGSFERVIKLPEVIDTKESKATFKNGVLSLSIPKAKDASRTHKLKVETH